MDFENLLLKDIFNKFDFNVRNLNVNKLGNSANLIYEFKDDSKEYILRISKNHFEKLGYYEEEMDFINYLFNGEASVSKVIPSKNKRLIEAIELDGVNYFISIFEKAKGNMPDINNAEEWNRELFYKWGQVMGKLHSLSKAYSKDKKKVIRNQWDEDIYFSEEFSMKDKDDNIYKVWSEILSEIKTLPKNEESYGLIHYDFHQYNFFHNNGDITVFDFDDCLYHWFACDIAIATYHATEAMKFSTKEEKNKFALRFIDSFLMGYLTENHLESYWVEKLPLFLEYRRICSYIFMTKLLSGKTLDEGIKTYMLKKGEEIKNRMPYIEINLKGMV